MRFRKKSIIVEATQWFKNGDHPNDYDHHRNGFDGEVMRTWSGAYARQQNWEGDVVRYYRVPHIPGDRECQDCGNKMHDHGWIDTFDGGYTVCPGDWIITTVNGGHYPVKDEILRDTYEEVGDAT